ncbi:MAG: hypothetical protein G01um10143_81 [Parcubacteria group bacterium Gr01-1014_3]|nr:MAG: hypothetical protein G01um10143_81 [Parcubacteria group bacterium Gr01-1014_3]
MTLPPLEPAPKNEEEYDCQNCGRSFKVERVESVTIEQEGLETTRIFRRNPAQCPSCGRSTHVRRKEVGK